MFAAKKYFSLLYDIFIKISTALKISKFKFININRNEVQFKKKKIIYRYIFPYKM